MVTSPSFPWSRREIRQRGDLHKSFVSIVHFSYTGRPLLLDRHIRFSFFPELGCVWAGRPCNLAGVEETDGIRSEKDSDERRFLAGERVGRAG